MSYYGLGLIKLKLELLKKPGPTSTSACSSFTLTWALLMKARIISGQPGPYSTYSKAQRAQPNPFDQNILHAEFFVCWAGLGLDKYFCILTRFRAGLAHLFFFRKSPTDSGWPKLSTILSSRDFK